MPRITYKWIGLICLLGLVINALSSPCNESRHFVCRNNASICIPLTAVRDGKADCPDNSDEEPCLADEFQCRSNAQCIPLAFFQDGHEDCDDGSDEECREDEYTCLCGFPRCIPQSRLKDGVFDCVEGSDEVTVDEDSFSCSFLDDNDNEVSNRKKRQVSSGPTFNLTNLERNTGLLSSTVQTVVHDGLTSMITTEVYGENAPDGQYFRFFSTAKTTVHPSITSSIEWGEQVHVGANKKAMMAKIEDDEEFKKQATIFSNFYSSDHPYFLKSSLEVSETVMPTFPVPDWTPRETISANVLVSGKLLPSRPPFTSSKAVTKKVDPIKAQRLPKGNDFVYPAYVITYTIGEEKLVKKSRKVEASKVTKEVTTTEMTTSETLPTAEDNLQELQEPATESSLQDLVVEPVSNDKLKDNIKLDVHKKPLSPLHTHTVGIGEANILPTARSRFFRPSPAIIRGNVQQTTRKVTFLNPQTTRKNIVKHSKITLKGFVDFTTTVSGTEIVFVPQSTKNAETTFKIQPSKSLFEHSISEMNEIVDDVRDPKQDLVLNKITTTNTHEVSKEVETMMQATQTVADSKSTKGTTTEISIIEETTRETTSVEESSKETTSTDELSPETISTEEPSTETTSTGEIPFELTSEITGVLITSEDISSSLETDSPIPMQTIELKPTMEESFSEHSDNILFETIDFHNKPNTDSNPFSAMVDMADMDLLQPEDEFPLGIISSTEGILENDGTTTLFTTIVIGTFIEGNYAQVIQSTSSLLHTIVVEEDIPSQTEFTTYTHYSTIIKDNFPSIVTSFDTVSNIVPESIKSEIQPSTTFLSEDATTFVDFNVVNGLFPSATSAIHVENNAITEVSHHNRTSALSNNEDQLVTTFSTFTHYTTITRGSFPFITSNVEIVSQVFSTVDTVNELTSTSLLNETQFTTLTAFTTETQLSFPTAVSSQETITNIIQDSNIGISEESIATKPSISVSPIIGTLLFTSYSTILRGDISTVTSIVVTSTLPVAEVVLDESITTIPFTYQTIIRNSPLSTEEKLELQSQDSPSPSIIEQVSAGVKTMFTTLTQFVTSYNGNFPSVSSSTIVISNLITESLETSINQLQSSENVDLNTPEETAIDVPSMMTRFTTYTYFTTFFLQDGTSVASHEVTSSEIVGISVTPLSPIDILPTMDNNTPTPSLETMTTASSENVQTLTYTFFTTYIRDGHSFISSREELMTVPITNSKNENMTDNVKTITNNVTYLTTLFLDNSTSATSNVIIETSLVPIEGSHTKDLSGIAEGQVTSSVLSEIITATNTYYTTFFLDGSTSVVSREETATEVVLKTIPILLMPSEVLKTEPDEVAHVHEHAHAHNVDTDQSALPQEQFNTFTQFTTFFLSDSSSVTSSIVIVPRKSVAIGNSNVVESTISPIEPVGRSVKDFISTHSSSSILSLAQNVTESQVLVAILNPLAESSQTATTLSEFQVSQANSDLNIDLLNQSETVKESKFVRNISQLVLNNLTFAENSTHLPMMVNEVTKDKSFTKYLLPSSSYSIGELQLPSPVLRTLYTTFTYYTTFYSGEHTLTSTRLETISSVTTDTIQPSVLTSSTDTLKSVYTTYTYFTTFIKDGITSITSDESTQTNVITDTSSIQLHSSVMTKSYPMTKYTTFTYYTTFYDGDTSTTKSHEEIKSTVYYGPETASRVRISTVKTVTPEQLHSSIVTPKEQSSVRFTSEQQSNLGAISTSTTFYTTFTYYTTSYKDDQTFITSRLETSSTVITDTIGVTFTPSTSVSSTTELTIKPTPSGSNVSTKTTLNKLTTSATNANNILTPGANNILTSTTQIASTSATSSKIGLLSTINNTDIKDGLTTAYVTEVYGTYIDGMYAHIQQTSSSIFIGPDVAIVSSSSLPVSALDVSVVTPTSLSLVNLYPTGLVTETSGSILNGGTITLFTSRVIGTYIEGTYAQIVESTSRILLGAATASHVQEKTISTTDDLYKTGLVSTIAGSSEVSNGITTQHETQVIGTYIEGSYAQILQPTTRILTLSILLTSDLLETTKTTSNLVLPSIPTSTSSLIDSSPVQELNDSSSSSIKPTSSRFRPTVRPFNSRLRPSNFFNRKSTTSSLNSAVSVTASAATVSKTRPFARGSSSSKSSVTKSSSGSFRGSSSGFRGSSSQGYRPTNSRNGGRGSSYPGSRSNLSGSRASSYPGRSSSGRSSNRASSSTKAGPTTRGKFTFRPRNSRFSKSSVPISSSPYATSSVYYKPSSRGSTAFSSTAENSLIEPSFDTTLSSPSFSSSEDPEENENEDVIEETVTVTSTSRVIADKQVSKSSSTNKQNEDENEDIQDENVDKRKVLFRHFRPGQRRPLFPRNRSKNKKDKNIDIDDQKESGSELHEVEAESGKIFVHEFAEEKVSRKKRSPRKQNNSEESGEDYGMKKRYRFRYQRPNRSTISPSKSQSLSKSQTSSKSQSATPRKITIRARSSKFSSKTKESSQTIPTRTTKSNLRTQTQRRRAKTVPSSATLNDTPTQTVKVRSSKTRSRSRSTKRNNREKFTIRPTATRRSRLTTRNRSDYTRKVVATRRRIGEARHAPRSKSAISDSWGSGSMKRNKQVIRTPLMPPLITVTHTVNTSKVLTIFHGRETEIRTLPTTSLSEQTLRTNDYSTVHELGKTKFVLESSIVTDILNPTIAHITEVIITSTVKPTATISRLRGGGRETKTSTVTLYGVTTVVSESTQLVPLQANNQLASLLLPQLLLNQFFPNQQQQQLSLTTSYYTHVTTTTVHSSSIIPLVFRGKTKYSTLSERKVYPTTIITSTTLPVTVAPNYPAINPLFPLFNPLQYQLLQPQLQQQQQQLAPPSAVETIIQPSIVTLDPELYEPEFELESEEEIEIAPPPPPKRETKHPKPERTTPITSVLTLYLSGEKPGQFNSFITTVTLNANDDDEAGRVRREAGIISKPTDILEMTALPELYDLIGDDETYHQDIRNNANVILVSALTDIDEYGVRKDLETDSLDNYKEELIKNSQDSDSQEDVVEDEDGLESDEVEDDEEAAEHEQVFESTVDKREKRAIEDNEEEEEELEDEEDLEDEPIDEPNNEDTKLRTYTRYYTRFKDGSHQISSTVETVTKNPSKSIRRGFTVSQHRGPRVLQTKSFKTDEPEDADDVKPITPVKLVRQKVSRVRRPVSRKLVRVKPKVTTDNEQQFSTKDLAEVFINNPRINRLVPKPSIALDVDNDDDVKEENQDTDSDEEDYEDETEETTPQPTFTISDVENSFTSEEATLKLSRSRIKLIRVRPSTASSNSFGSKRIISTRRIKVPIRETVSNKIAKPISTLEIISKKILTSKIESNPSIKGSKTRTRLFPTHPVALTYYTTFTYFSTLISDGITQMRSREAVTSVVITEPLNTRVASIIQTSAGYSVPIEDARLTNFGTRTRKGVTTIVNAGSRIRLSDGGILPTLPPSEHVIKVKPTERPIVTSINGRRHGVGPGDAPRTYLTIYTYYYTFIDESETKYSSSEATHRELVRGSTKPLPENFQRTEDSFGLYTLNTDSPLTNLGFRVLGDRTTSVNLGDKTIVMFGNVPMSATSTKLLTDNPTILTDFSTTSSPSRIFATRTRVLKPKGSRYKVLRTRVKPSSQPSIESSFEFDTTEEPIFESTIKPSDDEIEFESTYPLESSFETEISHDATTSKSLELTSVQTVISKPALTSSSLSSSKFRYQSTRGSSFRGSSSGYPSSSSSSSYSRRGFGSRKPFTRIRSSSSKPLPSNVVYVTYTTTTLVPFLGGTHTRTLNVVTSSLRTLAPEELAQLTASQQQSSDLDSVSSEIEATDSISDTKIQSNLQSPQPSSFQTSTFPLSSSSTSLSSSSFSSSVSSSSSSSLLPSSSSSSLLTSSSYPLISSVFSSSKFPSSSSNMHPFLSSSKSFTSPYSTLSRLTPSSVQSSITELETTRTILETLTTTYTYIITRLDGTSQVVSTKEESTTEVVTKTLTETVTSTLSLSSTSVGELIAHYSRHLFLQ
uniref:DUF4758 domain-containing protein n=1 Tax=Strigamia maritima TaxID=126957 RepID=T1IYS1_STRMM